MSNLRDYLPQFSCVEEMQAALERILSRDYADTQVFLSSEDEAEIQEICRTKFSTWEWNYGLSPRAGFTRSAKLPCGTVEVSCSIVRGKIRGLSFGGDFIGSLPAEGLASALDGCRFDRASIMEALHRLSVSNYFDNTSPDQLADLFLTFDQR